MSQEVVFSSHDESHVVMSEKVRSLAGSIYQEFERMIGKYDEEVVQNLMPLVVNVLECLDLSYTENQEQEVELELLREDNEQLVTQYEREKQLRRSAEQKLLEMEDVIEDEKKTMGSKIESLESIVRMFELKFKNSSDHVCRLEEKEQEMKKEYSKLHERYTELFKTHMDHIERTKILMGSSDRVDLPGRTRMPMSLAHLNRSSGPVSFGFSSLEQGPPALKSMPNPGEFGVISGSPQDSSPSQNELSLQQEFNSPQDLSISEANGDNRMRWSETLSAASKDNSPEEISEDTPPPSKAAATPVSRSHTKSEKRSANTLYQELSFQDNEALGDVDDGAEITEQNESDAEGETQPSSGMGKEIENLIMENNELLATKNALNIVKDDLIAKVDELTSEQEILRDDLKSISTVKARLKQKVADLEDELRRVKEECDKLAKSSKSDDEEDVPMAQRKRFTRVEMARVLMERNQYKEKFMELQEAVRWSELLRASKNDPNSIDKKNKHTFWRFFDRLFSGGAGGDGNGSISRLSYPNVQFNVPTHHVSPAMESLRKKQIQERKRGLDYIDSNDLCSEKVGARRASERKEQYRQVRAHVAKEDGRVHAYGWSLPVKQSGPSPTPPVIPQSSSTSNSQVPVPVPVYCRPLMEKEPGMKIWCATGVNLTGGVTRDGGSVVGASVFYSYNNANGSENDSDPEPSDLDPALAAINHELKEGERRQNENETRDHILSSLVWICTSTHSVSKVTIIDANNPADILEAFNVCPSHLLCIASVPGAKEIDYSINDDPENEIETEEYDPTVMENGDSDDNVTVGKVTYVSCETGSDTLQNFSSKIAESQNDTNAGESNGVGDPIFIEQIKTEIPEPDPVSGSPVPPRRLVKEIKEGLVKDGIAQSTVDNEVATEEMEKMSSLLPTVWLGSKNGCVFVHSAVAQWRRCLHSVKLKDSVLSIVHLNGRVFCALADGTVAVFKRGRDGQWDLSRYHSVVLGPSQHSVRCLVAVHNKIWCGCKNVIHVLDSISLSVQHSFVAHPRKDSQVRQMAWVGDGVWVSIRLDSTLRLYHAHTTKHLQDVDIEPYVSKMLGTGKLGFSLVRITALLISSQRLWIGTGNGVIISVPLSESAGNNNYVSSRSPGGMVRVFSDPATFQVTPASYIPYCSMSQAQLSFHGHRDAVKFFVAVPGQAGFSAATSLKEEGPIVKNVSSPDGPASMLILSGGEGYIDFRIGNTDDPEDEKLDEITGIPTLGKRERSYLIVWQMCART
nr:PREDICTED: C-Jun-amino-terminal kinase-interacting protein 4 isoform X6 [Bemisia tabaci]